MLLGAGFIVDFDVVQGVIGHKSCQQNYAINKKLLSQKKFLIVVMKFQVNQNLIKNTRFTITRAINAKFSSSPKLLVGRFLKFALR